MVEEKNEKNIHAWMGFTGRRSRVVTTHIPTYIHTYTASGNAVCAVVQLDLKHQGSNQGTLYPIQLCCFVCTCTDALFILQTYIPLLTPGATGGKK